MIEIPTGIKVVIVINALLLIVTGFFLIFTPGIIVWVVCAAIFFHGIQLILRYFAIKDRRNGWDIVTGIISVLLGFFLLFSSPETRILEVLLIEVIIAFWIFVAGIGKVIDGFGFMVKGAGKNIWGILGGIVLILCGIVLVARPVLGAAGLVIGFAVFVGVSLIFAGITELIFMLSGKSWLKPV